MKCFRHGQSEAVGLCKHCLRGVCNECAIDTGFGLACSTDCRNEVLSLKAMVERNKKSFPLASKSLNRNAILYALLGVTFAAFSIVARGESFLPIFFTAFAVVMFIGAIFSFLNARKWSKASSPQRSQ